jgi:ubiquinone/menaquinone biosynthesis C-methylase UbiE
VSISSASHKKTNDKVFELVSSFISKKSKILDLGAGRGHLSRRIHDYLIKNKFNSKSLIATDFEKKIFQANEVAFKQADFNKELPFPNASFDIVYSVEVIEHLRCPYDFLDECYRILKPNGMLIISTPNTLSLNSRLKFFVTGFSEFYKPPSIKPENAGRLCGHIMPLHLAYYDYGLRKSGFGPMKLFCDKVQSRSKLLYYFLFPLLKFSHWKQMNSLESYDLDLYNETKHTLVNMTSYTALTSRSLLFVAKKH